jgi:hypothetical protein
MCPAVEYTIKYKNLNKNFILYSMHLIVFPTR